ncbi:MAG: hypothetical protein OXT69_09635 [Candidatus Poribacteria bacterium]|nr:hypothetical protein [Candidatus Poribacteria bacterium]
MKMKPYRILLTFSLYCLLAAVVWVLQRGGTERGEELFMLIDESPTSAYSFTSVQTPPQEALEAAAEAAETEEAPAETESAAVQYNFQSWEDAMDAYAELAGLAYDKYKAQGAPEEVFAAYNALLEKNPRVVEHLGLTRDKKAEQWAQTTAVEETFGKLQTEYLDLLNAMKPFLNDIPVREWATPNVLARARRIPMSETQHPITLSNGEAIDR